MPARGGNEGGYTHANEGDELRLRMKVRVWVRVWVRVVLTSMRVTSSAIAAKLTFVSLSSFTRLLITLLEV